MMIWRFGVLSCIALSACGGDEARTVQESSPAPWEAAQRRGVDFRAVGNEPGWHLEIRNGSQLLLVTDYGMRRIEAPDEGAKVTGATTVYRGASQTDELTVDITETPCTDTMSGDVFPNRVRVILNGTIYQGCGQRLSAGGK